MKRFECVLEKGNESRSETIITNAAAISKGMVIKIKGVEWTVKVSVPADSDKVHFGDILHEVKK